MSTQEISDAIWQALLKMKTWDEPNEYAQQTARHGPPVCEVHGEEKTGYVQRSGPRAGRRKWMCLSCARERYHARPVTSRGNVR